MPRLEWQGSPHFPSLFQTKKFQQFCFCSALWLTHPTAKMSEEVNMKRPHRNTTVQLSTPYTDPECTINFISLSQTDRWTDDTQRFCSDLDHLEPRYKLSTLPLPFLHTHTHRFNSHFPGASGLADYPLDNND